MFKRQSVGSFSNCLACHKGAEQGDFDDDRAAIPQLKDDSHEAWCLNSNQGKNSTNSFPVGAETLTGP